MPNRKECSDTADRKKEVLDAFLNTLIDKGVADTSVRDLSASINLQSAGMYYYFQTKEDLIVACAEEATIRLENSLIVPALKEIKEPHKMLVRLVTKSEEMAPTMKLLIQVCAMPKYSVLVQPVIDGLTNRYVIYAEKLADRLKCEKEEIEPYMYMTITALTNYMIFSEKDYIKPQIEMVETALNSLVSKTA